MLPERRDQAAASVPLAEGLTPFDSYLQLTQRELQPPVPLNEEEQAKDEALSNAVLEHFRTNRPAPSSLPAVSLQVLTAVAEPDASLSELTRLVSQDPALSAGLLKVANSPVYAGVSEIETLRDAVTRLGVVEVGRVAGTVAARSLFQSQVRSEFTALGDKWGPLFANSVTSARAAAFQAMHQKGSRTGHCFLAGMLHDLGRTVALRSVAALSLSGTSVDDANGRIDRVLERVHVEIGGEVHQEWGLPAFATLVAMRHHDSGLPKDGEYVDVHVVRLASAMVLLDVQAWRADAIRAEINESSEALGLDAYALRSLGTQIKEERRLVENSFSESKSRKRN